MTFKLTFQALLGRKDYFEMRAHTVNEARKANIEMGGYL